MCYLTTMDRRLCVLRPTGPGLALQRRMSRELRSKPRPVPSPARRSVPQWLHPARRPRTGATLCSMRTVRRARPRGPYDWCGPSLSPSNNSSASTSAWRVRRSWRSNVSSARREQTSRRWRVSCRSRSHTPARAPRLEGFRPSYETTGVCMWHALFGCHGGLRRRHALVVGARRFLVSARPPVIEPGHQSSCSSAKEPIAAVTVASQIGPFAWRRYVGVCTRCRFLACAFDTGQCLGIFGLGRFEGLKVGCF